MAPKESHRNLKRLQRGLHIYRMANLLEARERWISFDFPLRPHNPKKRYPWFPHTLIRRILSREKGREEWLARQKDNLKRRMNEVLPSWLPARKIDVISVRNKGMDSPLRDLLEDLKNRPSGFLNQKPLDRLRDFPIQTR